VALSRGRQIVFSRFGIAAARLASTVAMILVPALVYLSVLVQRAPPRRVAGHAPSAGATV
jgi:hypothetical protein